MSVIDEWRQLFLDARTHNGWLDQPVDDALLTRLYELVRITIELIGWPESSPASPLRGPAPG